MLVDGSSIYLAGRLNGPIDYRNATALLFCLPFWPFVGIAATRGSGRGRGLRGAALGLALLMLALAFTTQSRGVLPGLGVGALVSLSLGADRVRRAWLAVLCVGLIALASHWLLTPFTAYDGGHGVAGNADIRTAAEAMIALVLAGTAIGFVLAVFDAGLRVVDPGMRLVRSAARFGLVLAAVGAVGAGFVAVHGHPVRELRQKWTEFKSLQTTTTTSTRYTSAGGQRYDLWRVALQELDAHPLAGVGEAGYQFDYYRLRRSNRNLDDPHGLLFQVGAELRRRRLDPACADPDRRDRLAAPQLAPSPAAGAPSVSRPGRGRRHVPGSVAGRLDVANSRAGGARLAVSRGSRGAARAGRRGRAILADGVVRGWCDGRRPRGPRRSCRLCCGDGAGAAQRRSC